MKQGVAFSLPPPPPPAWQLLWGHGGGLSLRVALYLPCWSNI